MNRPSMLMAAAALFGASSHVGHNALEIKADRLGNRIPELPPDWSLPWRGSVQYRRDSRYAWKNRTRRAKRECTRRGRKWRGGR